MNEADKFWLAFCAMCAAVLLSLVGLAWFATYRYDKRVTLAIEHGYSIDHTETYSYQSPK